MAGRALSGKPVVRQGPLGRWQNATDSLGHNIPGDIRGTCLGKSAAPAD